MTGGRNPEKNRKIQKKITGEMGRLVTRVRRDCTEERRKSRNHTTGTAKKRPPRVIETNNSEIFNEKEGWMLRENSKSWNKNSKKI